MARPRWPRSGPSWIRAAAGDERPLRPDRPARNDIWDIVFGVDDRSGRAVALRVYESIHETLGRIAEHPEMGRTRPDRWPERYRFFPHGPSLIAYRADVRPIRIIRIARASRDWSRIEPSG